jgi:Flp pilus assembly protein TadG
MSPRRDRRAVSRRRDLRSGVAALEFALLLPMLLVLFVGVAEAVLYLRSWYRLDRTAAEVANIASQFETLSAANVAQLFDTARIIAAPIAATASSGPVTARARTVIAVVNGTAGGNTLAWSCSRGDAALAATIAGRTSLPNGFLVPTGQTVVVVEVINAARPWEALLRLLPGTVADPGPIRTYAIVRPRQGTLSSIGGSCPA